jgi:hypothetical protein
MKNNRILPMGLKGNQINERMMELMGINQINENKSAIAVELTKMGPDGKAYAIIRENHEYYIKSTDKTSKLVAEDFKYIGGLQNKKQEAYPSYAKAIKHLNLKFNSIQEALDTRIDINVFEDDNLLKEDIAGFSNAYGGGFSGEGNLEGNSALYEEEDLDGEEIPENPEDYTKQPSYIHEEDCEMSDEEKAIDEMLDESWMEEELTGNQDRIDMDGDKEITPKDFAILRNKKNMEEGTYEEGTYEENYMGEEEMGMEPQKPTLSTAKTNAEWIEALEYAEAKDIIASLYNELGAPVVKAAKKVVGFIGGPDVKDAINKRFPENESLYEGKLSINRAIDKMDSIIDSLIETDVKKKG